MGTISNIVSLISTIFGIYIRRLINIRDTMTESPAKNVFSNLIIELIILWIITIIIDFIIYYNDM